MDSTGAGMEVSVEACSGAADSAKTGSGAEAGLGGLGVGFFAVSSVPLANSMT